MPCIATCEADQYHDIHKHCREEFWCVECTRDHCLDMPSLLHPPSEETFTSMFADYSVPIVVNWRLLAIWQEIRIFTKFARNHILIHNWPPKKDVPLDTLNVYILFWTSRKRLSLRPPNSTRSRAPKAAEFFGCYFVFCTIISWKPRIWYTHNQYS